jgi:hypothetical protein
MERVEAVALAGAAVAAAAAVLVTLPYLVVDASAVAVYYDAGPVTPVFVGVLAVVAGVALVSGAQDRSDPATVAGVAVIFALFMAGLSLAWATAVDPAVVAGLPVSAWFDYHRWAVVAAALAETGLAGWYAKLAV